MRRVTPLMSGGQRLALGLMPIVTHSEGVRVP
jgi:hypothetical protein